MSKSSPSGPHNTSSVITGGVISTVSQSTSNLLVTPSLAKQSTVSAQPNRQPSTPQVQYSLPPPSTLPVQQPHHTVHHAYPSHQPVHPNVAIHRRENEAIMESSTPPTTPDSVASNFSGSSPNPSSTPSSSVDDKDPKMNIREQVDAENENPNKEEEVGNNMQINADKVIKPPIKRPITEIENMAIKKRKKRSQESIQPAILPIKKTVSKQMAKFSKHSAGSDSDETSEPSNLQTNAGAMLQSPNTQSNGPNKSENGGLTRSKLKHDFLAPLGKLDDFSIFPFF